MKVLLDQYLKGASIDDLTFKNYNTELLKVNEKITF